jgi:glutamate racemase
VATLKVGVFDSGVGGLTVLKELLKISKGVDYYYLGDTARVPYGIRSEETVKRYAYEGVSFLKSFNIDLLVVACNTVSARAMNFLKNEFPGLEIHGVIEPAVERVLKVSRKSVGVIGTPATVGSGIYKKLIEERSNLRVFQKATPLFVPLVEEGLLEGNIAETVIRHYLSEWEGKIDTLLLGCTHYPLLRESIQRIFPYWVVVDSATTLAEKLKTKLEKGKGQNRLHLYFTDKGAFLENLIKLVGLEKEIDHFEVVKI